MFKVETIQQYKIVEYIKQKFDLKTINLELINRFAILIRDSNNDSAIFSFNDKTGEIEIDYDDEYVNF